MAILSKAGGDRQGREGWIRPKPALSSSPASVEKSNSHACRALRQGQVGYSGETRVGRLRLCRRGDRALTKQQEWLEHRFAE